MGWSIDDIMCGHKFLGYAFRSVGGSFDESHCSRLQTNLLAKRINTPGQPYVSAKSPKEILEMADEDGFVWVRPDVNSGQCVALVKAAIPALGPTRLDGEPNWVKGDDIDSSNVANLLPGTAIGYGFNTDGEYASSPRGNHVAIFVSAKGDTVTILDQWKHSDDRYQEATLHQVDIDDKDWAIVTRRDAD